MLMVDEDQSLNHLSARRKFNYQFLLGQNPSSRIELIVHRAIPSRHTDRHKFN